MKYRDSQKKGYTLVELLFVMGMVFLLAAISLVNYNRFGKQVELENAAYDVALTVRTAQFFGINRRDDLTVSFDDPKPYGVYFNTSLISPPSGISQESFMTFIDNDGGVNNTNNLFDDNFSASSLCVANSSTECLEIYNLNRGIYISELCAGTSSADCTVRDELHITFKRPNPDATIKSSSVDTHQYAEITISSPVSGIPDQKISLGLAGQISIQ